MEENYNGCKVRVNYSTYHTIKRIGQRKLQFSQKIKLGFASKLMAN